MRWQSNLSPIQDDKERNESFYNAIFKVLRADETGDTTFFLGAQELNLISANFKTGCDSAILAIVDAWATCLRVRCQGSFYQ